MTTGHEEDISTMAELCEVVKKVQIPIWCYFPLLFWEVLYQSLLHHQQVFSSHKLNSALPSSGHIACVKSFEMDVFLLLNEWASHPLCLLLF